MGNGDNPVILDFDGIEVSTERALLLYIGDEKVWIPKTLIRDLDEEVGEITVPEWFALKAGLI